MKTDHSGGKVVVKPSTSGEKKKGQRRSEQNSLIILTGHKVSPFELALDDERKKWRREKTYVGTYHEHKL